MKDSTAHMHYVSREISPEQFIAEHTFVYIIKGLMNTYDGSKHQVLKAGDCCIGRKNRLVRYNKAKVNDELEKVFVFFDEAFLRQFQDRYKWQVTKFESSETLIGIKGNDLLPTYIQSLLPYYSHLKIAEPFADVKREELLLILLKSQPELAGLLFNYGTPEKINIEEFMNRNFKFNVSLERFAYLTGRSLSAFKRDFKETFGDSPSRWLVRRRLQEAYFLIEQKKHKSSDIYLDLGFETLQHFSSAFKKQFGMTPTQLAN
ncbi:helix-turn-helix domain-containing protein [Dyadobacter subterraneus]|uniref:Helix-turn-helix transcriptional regulator n=2 Tax=Dyadobacter subterraneus TaxID=2773304 RepID=A0ABR9WFV0_9BACT|nr:AraC family transcriptional regulator [Dyadobacter subterraneus]MBE9463801.1 helix-turn-helix transcriptional regulator [Dyadobacter subterraneus]